jgi:hypothetical protein
MAYQNYHSPAKIRETYLTYGSNITHHPHAHNVFFIPKTGEFCPKHQESAIIENLTPIPYDLYTKYTVQYKYWRDCIFLFFIRQKRRVNLFFAILRKTVLAPRSLATYPSNTGIDKRPSLILTIVTIYLNSTRPYNVHYTSNMHSQFHLELIFQTVPASHYEAGLWNLKTPFYLVLLHSQQPSIFAFYHRLSARIDSASEMFCYFAVWRHTVYHLSRGA